MTNGRKKEKRKQVREEEEEEEPSLTHGTFNEIRGKRQKELGERIERINCLLAKEVVKQVINNLLNESFSHLFFLSLK